IKGGWNIADCVERSYDLEGMNVGTVAAGRIGLAALKRLKPFDVKLHYTDKHRLPKEVEQELGVTFHPKVSALAITIGITQFIAVAALAADYDIGSLHLAQPWSRATPKGASAGAAYLTVTNNGAAPDRLSCAGSDAAAQCQIHTMSMENGVMKMRPVEGGLEIRPGEMITLKPGGDHLMLTQIKHPLEAGKTVQATLEFEKAGTLKGEVAILAAGR